MLQACDTYSTKKKNLGKRMPEETINEIIKVEQIVREELRSDIRARNEDKWLTYKIMRKFTPMYLKFEDFCKIPSFETIRRTRQQIQNGDKLYPPTSEEVLAKRQKREKVFREYFVK